MIGELSILNCSAGDIKVKFDKSDREEIEKAKSMIADMLKRGYLLAIDVDGVLEPVKEFDPEKEEYVILEAPKPEKGKPKPKPSRKRVKMSETKATCVPRTGGG